jgi:2-hydroxycyclohexanecarboxyl-CoA dehydrogenase
MGLENKTAIITGGAVGIGKAIATRLARDGANIAILDVSYDKAAETVEELEAGGTKAMAVQCDITNYQQTKEAVAAVQRTMGSIDILVNNAGVDKQQLFAETGEALWDWMIAINYKGFLVATHATIPYMMEQKSGTIVNLGSDAGRIGNAREVVYSGTKAAVMASTKALAQELARYNVRVNAVSPGPIQQTELLGGLFEGEIGEKIAKLVPMRRLGTPEDVADVVAFFVSDDSRYLTGQVLSIDGGLTMIG